MDVHYHFRSFREAFNGLKHAFSEHPNFRIHAFLSIFVLILALFFQLPKIDLTLLILTISMGFIVEFLNTALESVCDLVTLEWRKNIQITKDVAAAMMLITAFFSLVIAVIIFYPYIFAFYSGKTF